MFRGSIEWLAFEAGEKPALRLALPDALVVHAEQAAQAAGWSSRRAALSPDAREQIVYVARGDAAADALRAMEAGILPGCSPKNATEDHRKLGLALGFPACCVEAFVERLRRDVRRTPDGSLAHEDYAFALDAASRTRRFFARLNMLLPGRREPLVSFYPCRFDCPEALAIAARVYRCYQDRAPARASELHALLLRGVAVSREGARRERHLAAAGDFVLVPDEF